jgi:hypothetical protein
MRPLPSAVITVPERDPLPIPAVADGARAIAKNAIEASIGIERLMLRPC